MASLSDGLIRKGELRRPALQAAVILGCVGLLALFGSQANRLSPKMVLAGVVGLLFCWLCLRSMEIGLTAFMAVGGVVGFSIGTGTESSISPAMMLVALCAGLWVVRMVTAREIRLAASGLNVPLLGFLGSAMLSWIVSRSAVGPLVTLPGNFFTVQAGQFGIYALAAAAFWLGANHQVEERVLKIWTTLLIGLGMAVFVWDLAAGWRHNPGYWMGSLFMWPVVLLVAQLLFNPRISRGWRLVGWGAVPLWGLWTARACIGFKGGWVPALLSMLLLLLLKSWRHLAAGLLVLVLLVAAVGPSQITNLLLDNEQDSASVLRSSLWEDVFRMGLRSPVVGLGLASYSYYWNVPSFQSKSYQYVNHRAFSRQQYTPAAHNMFADVFAQMGGVGLGFLLWAIAAGLRLGLGAHRSARSGFGRAYAAGVLCGFVSQAVSSFFFADWLLPYVYNLGFYGFPQAAYTWLLLGSLVPLARQADAKRGSE
jgi:hypothetical protein